MSKLTIEEIIEAIIKDEEMDKEFEKTILFSIITMNASELNILYNRLKSVTIQDKGLTSSISINRLLTVIRLIEAIFLSQTPKEYDSVISCDTSNDTICFDINYSDLAFKSKKSKLLLIFDKMKIKGRKNIKLANKAIDIIESL